MSTTTTKFVAHVSAPNAIRAMIEEDPAVGFYLTIYPDGSPRSVADHLCDTMQDARRFAREKYGIPAESWTEEHS